MEKQNNSPLISILVTVFNREQYLLGCVTSILKSSYTNFELIILDDCSTDKSFLIAKNLALTDPRIQLYKNEHNLGQFANRNKIVEYARGQYIKYVDSDDFIYPNCIETMVEAAVTYPDAGLIGELYFDAFEGSLPLYLKPEEAILGHFFKGNRSLNIGPTSLMYKKDVFLHVGGFRTDIGILADVPLNYEIAMLAPIVGVKKGLIYWRIHDEQVTVGQKDIEKMMVERYQINQLILNHPNMPIKKATIKKIKRNIKNILVRNLFKKIVMLKLDMAFRIAKKTNLTIKDFAMACRPNYKYTDHFLMYNKQHV